MEISIAELFAKFCENVLSEAEYMIHYLTHFSIPLLSGKAERKEDVGLHRS